MDPVYREKTGIQEEIRWQVCGIFRKFRQESPLSALSLDSLPKYLLAAGERGERSWLGEVGKQEGAKSACKQWC
jgi:hypothetical protein